MPGQYNPESILQEQFESHRKNLDDQFRFRWNDVNKRAQEGLFKSQKEYEETLHDLHVEIKTSFSKFEDKVKQAVGQFQQIDKLAEMGAIKDPDEVKWRMVLGPEAEKAMFQQPVDPREEHPC